MSHRTPSLLSGAALLTLISGAVGCATANWGAEADHLPEAGKAPYQSATSKEALAPAPAGGASDGPSDPAQLACAIESSSEKSPVSFTAPTLSLVPGGPPFVRLVGPPHHARVAIGKADGASSAPPVMLDVSLSTVSLRGYVTLDEAPLTPAKPIVLGGFAAPAATQSLELKWVGDGSVGVAWLGGQTVQLKSGVDLGKVACADLTLHHKNFVTVEALPKDPAKTPPVFFKDKAAIKLFSAPGGAEIGQIVEARGPGLRPELLDEKDGQSRVRFCSDEGCFVAWVSSKSLDKRPASGVAPSVPEITRKSILPTTDVAPPPASWATCGVDVPIQAELSGKRGTVGAIRANSCFRLEKKGNDVSDIGIRGGEIQIEEGARLVVSTALLNDCIVSPADKIPEACR